MYQNFFLTVLLYIHYSLVFRLFILFITQDNHRMFTTQIFYFSFLNKKKEIFFYTRAVQWLQSQLLHNTQTHRLLHINEVMIYSHKKLQSKQLISLFVAIMPVGQVNNQLKKLYFSGSQKFKKLTKNRRANEKLLSTKKPKKSLHKAFRLTKQFLATAVHCSV